MPRAADSCEVGTVGTDAGVRRPSKPATVRSGATIQRCWVTTTPGHRLCGGIDTQADVPSDGAIDGHGTERALVPVTDVDLVHGQGGWRVLEGGAAEDRVGEPGLYERGGLAAVERPSSLGAVAGDAAAEDLEPGGELAERVLAARGGAGRGAGGRRRQCHPQEAARTDREADHTPAGTGSRACHAQGTLPAASSPRLPRKAPVSSRARGSVSAVNNS